jgi:hypothetical protein
VTRAYSFDLEAKLNSGQIFLDVGARLILREYSKLRDILQRRPMETRNGW